MYTLFSGDMHQSSAADPAAVSRSSRLRSSSTSLTGVSLFSMVSTYLTAAST